MLIGSKNESKNGIEIKRFSESKGEGEGKLKKFQK